MEIHVEAITEANHILSHYSGVSVSSVEKQGKKSWSPPCEGGSVIEVRCILKESCKERVRRETCREAQETDAQV